MSSTNTKNEGKKYKPKIRRRKELMNFSPPSHPMTKKLSIQKGISMKKEVMQCAI
jgi:hypothetical protein